MTDLEPDVDPAFEQHLRQTLAAIAATSSLAAVVSRSRSPRRWSMAAALVLVVAGLVATGFVVARPDGNPPSSDLPGWYTWLQPSLPEGFDHVSVLMSTSDYVTFEAADLATSALLNLTVSRHEADPDPAGAITLTELASVDMDIDQNLNVSLPDGRQIGVTCIVINLSQARDGCGASVLPFAPEQLRRTAYRLAELPIRDLPAAVENQVLTVDRATIATSAVYDVTGLSVRDGIEHEHVMYVYHDDDDVAGYPLQVRATGPYVPTLSDQAVRSVEVSGTIIASRAIDGWLWMVSSKLPDEQAPSRILTDIADQFDAGTLPTVPPQATSVAPG